MAFRSTIFFLLHIVILLPCSGIEKKIEHYKKPGIKSMVAFFYYGGYGDKSFATLIRQVFN